MEYLQSGKYTKSMSQLITDSPSVTEMKLQKTEPWPLNEFEKQFDLQHLPQKSQKHALKVFKKKINIFCRHEMDIGCANDIEMDIEIDSSKPRIQKYYRGCCTRIGRRPSGRGRIHQFFSHLDLPGCPIDFDIVGFGILSLHDERGI